MKKGPLAASRGAKRRKFILTPPDSADAQATVSRLLGLPEFCYCDSRRAFNEVVYSSSICLRNRSGAAATFFVHGGQQTYTI